MPPKKKFKEPVQTKLNFRPISAPSPSVLFSLDTSAPPPPLRSTMSILNHTTAKSSFTSNNSTNNYNNNSFSSDSSTDTLSLKENSSPNSFDSPMTATDRYKIGGKSSFSANRINNDVYSTTDLVSATRTGSLQGGYQIASHKLSEYENNIPGDSTVDRVPSMEKKRDYTAYDDNDLVMQDSTRKRRAQEPTESAWDTHGSSFQPVDLDSDSDDDLLVMPPGSEYSIQPKQSRPITAPKTLKPISLLDQMATPRGTQPMPRSTGTLARTSSSSSLNGRSIDSPIFVSGSSTVSDDGFNSGSSLDDRLKQLRHGSGEPEMEVPGSHQNRSQTLNQSQTSSRSQASTTSSTSGSLSSSRHQLSQPHGDSSLQAKVKLYSQKRAGDFATVTMASLATSTPKRTLPATVNRYQSSAPVPQQPYSRSGSSSSISPSLANSFSNAQQKAQARSRSSSPTSTGGGSGTKVKTPGTVIKEKIVLSAEQQHVLEQVVLYQKSLFFTGSAGTGKSVLLRELIIQLRQKYNKSRSEYWEPSNDAIAVTASTGIAACNIGGCTLHSFAGVGLGQEALPVLIAKVRKNNTTARRWQETKVLVVDEVSMIDADFMDKLEAVAREVRKDQRPWGGMQVVLVGDFFQLPPVNKNGTTKFCFEGESWKRAITTTIQLRQVFRQKDQTFADMLNEMRLGSMSPPTIEKFKNLTRELSSDDGLRPTELFPLRNQVEEANNRRLTNLRGKTMTYQARDRGPQKEKMEQNCLAPTNLLLKVDSQVMLLRNQSGGAGGLVNGSLGVVVKFSTQAAENDTMASGDRSANLNTPGEELPVVRFKLENGQEREMVVGREEWKIELPNGNLQGARVQIPLSLAWSLSIHKAQGQTLPKVRVDLGKVFEKGQAYVALSRATSLDGLQVLNFDPRKVMVHPKVIEFYNSLKAYDAEGSSRRVENESSSIEGGDNKAPSKGFGRLSKTSTFSSPTHMITSSKPGSAASTQIARSFYQ